MTFTRSDLNKLIGRTMRRIQLANGYSKDCLRSALRWLNLARRELAMGLIAEATDSLEMAMERVRWARRWA